MDNFRKAIRRMPQVKALEERLQQYNQLVGGTAGELQKATGCTEDESFQFLKEHHPLTVERLCYIKLCAIGRNKEEGAAKSLVEVDTRLKEFTDA